MTHAPIVAALLGAAAAMHTALAVTGGDATSSDVAAGRALFERGEAAFTDGGTSALQARSTAYGRQVIAGAAAACANCHGIQAQGGGEGNLRAPSLRWPEWGSSSPALRAGARERLRAALRDGRGGDQRALAALMPRFDVDERTLDALAEHLQVLVADEQSAVPRRRFALLQIASAQALPIEREVHAQLLQCLRTRLAHQVEPVVLVIDNIESVGPALAMLQRQSDIVAVLAPPLREQLIGVTPPLLFPLVADPRPALREAVWLFGGPSARAVALLQAWTGAPERFSGGSAIGVWLDPESLQMQPAATVLASWSDAVERESGARPRLEALMQPQRTHSSAGLWIDANGVPPTGTWMVAAADTASPPAGSRWWTAQPYPGQPPRPLSQRWAAATCQTVGAAVAADPEVTRKRWPAALASIGRQRDAAGWDWQVRVDDRQGTGATDAWTVVEITHDGARVINPFVRIASPRDK